MKFLELSTMTNRFFCLTKLLFGDSQGSVAALRLRGGITTLLTIAQYNNHRCFDD